MRIALVVALLFSACARSDEETIVVHGDSTAIGSRIPRTEKVWNLVPSLDSTRWFNQLGRPVVNDGVKGAFMTHVRDRIVADAGHRSATTIIYDQINPEENVKDYLEVLTEAVGTLRTQKFLIMPQVPDSYTRDEGFNMASRKMRPLVDAEVIKRWPNNTLSSVETIALYRDLGNPETRADGSHRNARGQRIEAKYIRHWLDTKGW